MLKIMFAVGAMFFLAGGVMAAASEPIFEPVPMADMSADFDVLTLSAQSDVMPDYALSGGDVRPI